MTDNASQAAAQVEARRQSKYEKMVGEGAPAEEEGFEGGEEEAQEWVPRVQYTADATLDLTKLQVPQLRLAQGMTQEVTEQKARVGQYVLSNFGPQDEVILVPLAAQNIRTYKPDPRKPPACFAPTGVHGVGDPGIVCADCKLKDWGRKDPKTGRSTKPPCTEGVSVRAYSVNHRSVVDFAFNGAAIRAGQFVMQQAMAWGFGSFAVKLGSASTKNDKGTWFQPAVEMLDAIPEEHVEVAHKWLEAVYRSMEPQAPAITP